MYTLVQEIHPSLAHLTSDQIKELIHRFYKNERIDDLCSFFKIDRRGLLLHRLLPAQLSQEKCPNCGEIMIIPWPSKSRKKESQRPRCQKCTHNQKRRCYCAFCKGQLNKKIALSNKSKIDVLSQGNNQLQRSYYNAHNLSLSQAVALLALARCNDLASPARDDFLSTKLFAPKGKIGNELIKELNEIQIVKIEEDAGDIKKIQWDVVGNVLYDLIDKIEYCLLHHDWPDHWYSQDSMFAADLALAEAQEYFDICLHERHFSKSNSLNANSLIKTCLTSLSVGQCCYLIALSARNASDFMVKTNCSYHHAAINMLENFQQLSQLIVNKRQKIEPIERDVRCQRSMISYVFYDTFLGTNEDGFALSASNPLDVRLFTNR